MGDQRGRGRTHRELQVRMRIGDLSWGIDRLERRVARVHARLDGASVTLIPVAETVRPPAGGPDPSVELQRIVGARERWRREGP
jgi:hypothetical protein